MNAACKWCGVRQSATTADAWCARRGPAQHHEWAGDSDSSVPAKTEQKEPSIGDYENYEDYFRAWYFWDRARVLREAKAEARSAAQGFAGIGIGSGIAMVLSFQLNHSILWMIAHGICSWGYVIFRAYEGNY